MAIQFIDQPVTHVVASTQEAGQILCQKFDGSFVNCIRQCNKSAKKLLQLIVENFPSYRDECQFEGRTGMYLSSFNNSLTIKLNVIVLLSQVL